jgi:hypothetical protein
MRQGPSGYPGIADHKLFFCPEHFSAAIFGARTIMDSVMNHYKIDSLGQSKFMAADLLFCKGSRACNGPITIRSRLFSKGVSYETVTEQIITAAG